MFSQTPEDAAGTAREMALLSPDYVIPGPCSGKAFVAAAHEAMPGKVFKPYVGAKFVFVVGARLALEREDDACAKRGNFTYYRLVDWT